MNISGVGHAIVDAWCECCTCFLGLSCWVWWDPVLVESWPLLNRTDSRETCCKCEARSTRIAQWVGLVCGADLCNRDRFSDLLSLFLQLTVTSSKLWSHSYYTLSPIVIEVQILSPSSKTNTKFWIFSNFTNINENNPPFRQQILLPILTLRSK